jgi:purine-nucleoside phosphorylase
VAHIRHRDRRVPEVALILGSGLGELALAATDAVVFEAADIPGYPIPGVRGHMGQVVIGELDETTVVFFRGRFHCYEGHGFPSVTFPVRLAAALGCRNLLVTNAAGSLSGDMPPGSALLIDDHVNLAIPDVVPRIREVLGEASSGVTDRTVARSPYDTDWVSRVEEAAWGQGIPIRRGTYVWTLGPSYETPAEIAFFRRIGGHAVGMSTVPEAITAQLSGMRVAGISSITNLAAGLHRGVLSHDDVLEIAEIIRDKMITLVRTAVRERPPETT